jgi:hypothetical protein
MSVVDLELASGWKQVAPRSDGPELLLETDGQLSHVRGNFEVLKDFGKVGLVACPLAYDAQRREVYRYVCEYRSGQRDFSQIRIFNLDTGDRRKLIDLPVNQWVLWLFEWINLESAGGGRLFGLLASDVSSEDALVLRHQLCVLNPETDAILRRPLCRDAYYPIAFSLARRRIVFAGAEGVYVVGMKGERHATVQFDDFAAGRGASFAPGGRTEVVIGGGGLRLWNYATNQVSRLTQQGQFPTWSADGEHIWYSESSSDLFVYATQSAEAEWIVRIPNNRNREVSMARPPQLSRCGRYVGVPLSSKRLKGVKRSLLDAGKRERIFEESYLFCVVDQARREVWVRPGRVEQFRWL